MRKGQKMSKESKEKLRNARRGQGNFRTGTKHTPETIERMRQAKLGNKNPNYGKHPIGHPHSFETKEMMSQIKCELYKEKINHPRTGVKASDELRKKLSKAHIGQYVSEETRKKLSEAHKGENHWNWKEDRKSLKKSEKKHLDGQYRDWMNGVKNRDEWKCRISDENCKGRIEAHHILNWIDYPELRYSLTNGITLCQAHHPKGRAKEKRLEPLFTNIILNMEEIVSVSRK